jgi:hypothetical protein
VQCCRIEATRKYDPMTPEVFRLVASKHCRTAGIARCRQEIPGAVLGRKHHARRRFLPVAGLGPRRSPRPLCRHRMHDALGRQVGRQRPPRLAIHRGARVGLVRSYAVRPAGGAGAYFASLILLRSSSTGVSRAQYRFTLVNTGRGKLVRVNLVDDEQWSSAFSRSRTMPTAQLPSV